MGRKKAQECFLCYSFSDCRFAEKDHFFGASGQLGYELRAIFIVRNILDIRKSVCHNLIETVGSPSFWGIAYCSKCVKIINEAEHLTECIRHLQKKLNKLSTKIQLKLFKNIKKKQSSTGLADCSSRKPLDELRFQFSEGFSLETSRLVTSTAVEEMLHSSQDSLKLNFSSSKDIETYDSTNPKVKEEIIRPDETQSDFSNENFGGDEITNQSIESGDSWNNDQDSDGNMSDEKPSKSSEIKTQQSLKSDVKHESFEQVETNEVVTILENKSVPTSADADPDPNPDSESDFDAKKKREFFDEVAAANKKKIDYCKTANLNCFKCSICHYTFRAQLALDAHDKRVHQGIEDPFDCKICKRKFKFRWELEKHVEIHLPDQNVYYCKLCPRRLKFSNEISYKAHVQRVHNGVDKPFMCSKCENKYQNATALEHHLKSKHGVILTEPIVDTKRKEVYRIKLENGWKKRKHSKKFRCTKTDCKRYYETEEARDIHIKTFHEGEKFPFTCNLCLEKFQKLAQLDTHLKAHEKTNEPEETKPVINYSCKECDKTFKSKSSFLSHMKATVHLVGPKPYMCELCSKTFQSTQYLAEHQRLRHYEILGLDPIVCHHCGKVFAKEKTLNWHIKAAHSKDFKWKCETCDLGFEYENSLTIHMRIHTGEKPFMCSICSKSFAMKYRLNTHMRIHTGEKPYECTECGKTFADKPTYNRHVEGHKGVVQDCILCSKQFKTRHALRVHMNRHESDGRTEAIKRKRKVVKKKRNLKVEPVEEHPPNSVISSGQKLKYEVEENMLSDPSQFNVEIHYDTSEVDRQVNIIESEDIPGAFFEISTME